MNFFSKNFFFNLVWNLSKEFSSFVEILQQNCQKCILRVQRNTLTKTLCWLCETITDFGRENVRFAAEDLQHCTKICTICLQVGNWKNIFERNFTFSLFFRTSREHFFVFSLNHFRNGRRNCFFQAKRNISIKMKNLTKPFFSSFPDYEGIFPKLSLNYLRHGWQNHSLRVQKSTLRKVICFWEFFKRVFGLWAIIVQTSVEMFQQRCPNCILRVQRNSRCFCSSLSCFI